MASVSGTSSCSIIVSWPSKTLLTEEVEGSAPKAVTPPAKTSRATGSRVMALLYVFGIDD
jgi:hypothetical protein